MNVKKRYLDTKRVRTVKRKKEKLEGGISVENMINQERRNLKKINNEIWEDKSWDKDWKEEEEQNIFPYYYFEFSLLISFNVTNNIFLKMKIQKTNKRRRRRTERNEIKENGGEKERERENLKINFKKFFFHEYSFRNEVCWNSGTNRWNRWIR